ncbi:LysE/ArgO family amino acid transporter [Microbacterium sp. W1N]|uniref:LysE/ArgO family amino acid transporter n=1 Tax=Microbacterium festucae TaxID=2977531 RepID=UPI0021C14897|nr:LysE/ArgO family amino acid transporter [Microbacterium festucae]MCT9820858.1 LysE/ArgO family amino acid transporter [Microbacterium festucae]
MITAALAGLGLGLSLIIAIGAQNLFVLRQGVRREHAAAVAAVCAASDAVLIVLGVSGVGLVVHAVPWLLVAVRWAGCVFLVGYGLLAARRALRPSGAALAADTPTRGEGGPASTLTRTALAPTLLTCLALTWLNPHVYLDTVFLLGGVASTYGAERWWFAAGAVIASAAWFSGLAFGARYLGRVLATPRAWRILDGVIAVVMIALGVGLVLPG